MCHLHQVLLAALCVMQTDGSGEYQLSIDSSLQLKVPTQSKPREMTGVTLLSYAIASAEGSADVTIRQLQSKVSSEGSVLFDREMSRAGARFQTGSQEPSTLAYDNAPPALQKVLREFDAPIARIKIDGEGKETDRETLINADATLVRNGIVDNALFFHAPFFADKDRWESTRGLSLGNGLVARGVLEYVRGEANSEGLVEVRVSGTMAVAPGSSGPADVKNGVYKVKGAQWYDPAARAWRSGQVEIDVSLDVATNGDAAGATTGLLKLYLQRRGNIERTAQ